MKMVRVKTSRYNDNFDSDSQICAGKYSILSTNPGACQVINND